jgi:hypothetical protein
MIWEPIEKRYNPYSIRERQMFNSSAFAIAAGVVAVGSAAAGAAVSISAADRAAKAQGSASKKAAKREKEALRQFEADLAGIQAPQWNIGADIGDAERITGYNKAQLEKLYPGATSQRELASRAITDYMRGVVPQDVQEQTMRAVAERGGAGFNIATAGAGAIPGVATSPQFDFARNLGLTSLQLQQYGMSASQDWQRLAGAFIESPLQVGQARLGFEQAAADLEMKKAAAKIGARVDFSQGQYGRQMESIGSRLATQQAIGTGIQSIGSATSGALMGVGSAYSQLGAAQVGGTTYGSLAAAQQAAPYAASYSQIGQNNFVPKAQAVYS